MTLRLLFARLRQDRFMLVVAGLATALVLICIFVPLLDSTDPTAPQLSRLLQAPSWDGGTGGVFGTDELGRPLWLRLVYGLRTSFFIGTMSVLIGAAVGTTIGVSAGYFGGWVDSLAMRWTDVQMSFPALLFALIIISVLQAGVTGIILILGFSSWMVYARVVRGYVLSLKANDFVASVKSLGARPRRVMWRHLFPNSLPVIVSMGTLELARLMLAEASLSFLGFGVQAPTISLGTILAQGRDYLQTDWWVSTFAGVAFAVAVLTINLLGNWLQRNTDPTLMV